MIRSFRCRETRKRAHDGEEIILAKSGRPYARLVPLESPVTMRRKQRSRSIGMGGHDGPEYAAGG
ncbi:MAG: type II toxin-antitoxin system Phd/YefM family antitoxin [Pseudomonadota bacterium]